MNTDIKLNLSETDKLPSRNLLLAKQIVVESIYRSANIEGIGITFPETQTICDGMSISGYTVEDINVVSDLKKAWIWLFDNINRSINLDTICTLNRILGKYTVINAGCIRTVFDEPIRIPLREGEDYYPPVPKDMKELGIEINEILVDCTLDTALNLFCYVCKRQIFNNGNKRTATLITNMFMIKNNLGVLSIPVNCKLEFYNLISDYYRDDSKKYTLKHFLQSKCITHLSDN